MRLKDKLKNITLHFQSDEEVTIKGNDIIDLQMSNIMESFTLNSIFDEKRVDEISFTISKKANVLINRGTLKGTLFTILQWNVIQWIIIETETELLKIYPPYCIFNKDELYSVEDGKVLSEKNNSSDVYNIAQGYFKDKDENLLILISEQLIDEVLEESKYE